MLVMFFNAVGRLSWLMATIAKLLIAALILVVITDVALRNLGSRPLSWGVNGSEFMLLYITFGAMPWLVRSKGHVFVEFLRLAMPPGIRRLLEKVVYLGCVALCLYLSWYALSSLIVSVQQNAFEMRSFDMPRWAIFAPILAGFSVSALEWLRFLLTDDSMYQRDLLEAGGH